MIEIEEKLRTAARRFFGGGKKYAYWFSSAGAPCLRALVYDAQDADDGKPPAAAPKRLRDALAVACGNGVDEHFRKAAESLGLVTQDRHEFRTSGIRISGHSDILTPEMAIDVKLVGEKAWARRPHKKHQWQANAYSVERDLPKWGLFYIRASTIFDENSVEVETDLIVGESSVEMAQDLCGVWIEVEQHRKLRTLPERIYGAKPRGFPCHWCEHLERCAPPEDDE